MINFYILSPILSSQKLYYLNRSYSSINIEWQHFLSILSTRIGYIYCFNYFFYFNILIILWLQCFSFSSPESKPSNIFPDVIQIYCLLFSVFILTYVYVYTQIFLNTTCSACIVLLVCLFSALNLLWDKQLMCFSLRKTLSHCLHFLGACRSEALYFPLPLEHVSYCLCSAHFKIHLQIYFLNHNYINSPSPFFLWILLCTSHTHCFLKNLRLLSLKLHM